MRAGELRHRIILQSPLVTQNDFGDVETTYIAEAEIWARVETTTGDETIGAGRASASLTHSITIRSRTDIEPTWRVVWRRAGGAARVLNIGAIVPDNIGREMTLICSEIVQ